MKNLIELLKNFNFSNTDIIALKEYKLRDGFKIVQAKDYREMMEYFCEFSVYKNIIPLFTDRNSNYVCVYKNGLLKGKVCYLNHEEISLEPKFRSIESCINAINSNVECRDLEEFEENMFDYPLKNDSNFTEEDEKIIKLLYEDFNQETDEDVKIQLAFSIIALTPYKDLPNLYPLLDDDDMYIQARAIDIFGFHKYESAKEKLRELQTTAKHNGQTSAKIALKKIRDGIKSKSD